MPSWRQAFRRGLPVSWQRRHSFWTRQSGTGLDIIPSLHHGESFDMVMAEVMLPGRSVIAIAWSGNTDFMDNTNAVLVNDHVALARDDRAVYRKLWAEPDVAEATKLMRLLADAPVKRKTLGERPRSSMWGKLDGRPMLAALKVVG